MKVYLDNAATTSVAPEVFEAMVPILKNDFGNPSSTHFFGRGSKAIIEKSRRNIAHYLNCKPAEIIFTSEKKIKDVIPHLKKCKFCIGNYTGFSHLSVNLDIETLVIYGDCPPNFTQNL